MTEKCYYRAMVASLPERGGYLYPEQYKFLKSCAIVMDKKTGEMARVFPEEPCPPDFDAVCPHWPEFTVIDGSPRPPRFPEPEIYQGFRSAPRPLLRVMELHPTADLMAAGWAA